MRKYLYIIAIIALLFVSCGDDAGYYSGNEDPAEEISRNNTGTVEQTTIMYFLGSSLKSRYFDVYNIPDTRIAVAAGALGENGRLLIFLPSTSSATLYEIYRTTDGYSTEEVALYEGEGYTSQSSSTQEYLIDVITKSQEFAPANIYNLILSGHGTGWVPQDYPNLKSADYFSWDKVSDLEVITRAMGSSSDSDGYMEVTELREALEQVSTKFGYLLFDMCLMSNIETLYELRNSCDNIISSPCEVLGFGFPYQTVLPQLFENNGMDCNFKGACKAYYEDYENRTSYSSAAVSWCQTSYLDELAEALKQVNTSGVNSVDIDDLQCYENLVDNVYCDLKHYVEQACDDESMVLDFIDAMSLAFPVAYHTDMFYTTLKYSSSTWSSGKAYWVEIDDDNFSGVSTSEPSEKFTDEWVETSWAKATAKY